MFSKFSSFKKIVIKLVIWLVSLLILIIIYFLSLSYFHEQILAEKKTTVINLNDYNTVVANNNSVKPIEDIATSSSIIQKVGNEIVSFYSFFFELPVSKQATNINSEEKNNLINYLGSFPYTPAIIDNKKTDLRFDGITSAITFPLNYDWTMAGQEVVTANENKFNSYQFNSFKGPYKDKRCLQNNCLEQKENKLYYNGKLLSLPVDIKKLQAVSIGIIANRFVVGFTLKNNDYQADAFYFDDSNFSKIPNFKTITSSYFGLLGFGGELDDFLVVYGAYKGQAFRVRGDKVIDLNKFISHALMNNGFKAEIVKVKNGNYANWYITSATIDNPKFIKLWQDDNGEIVGLISLVNELKITDQLVELKLLNAESNKVSFLAHLKSNDYDSWQIFNDYGFKNKQIATLLTIPLAHNNSNEEVIVEKIISSELIMDTQGEAFVKTEISFDGLKWQKIIWGKNIDFNQVSSKSYFLKMIFSPVTNPFYSPYISSILFNYSYYIK